MLMELEESLSKIKSIRTSLIQVKESLDLDNCKNKIEELQMKMQESNFWDDPERAQEISSEERLLNEKIHMYTSLKERLDDVEVLAELAEEEEDNSASTEIMSEVEDIEHIIDKLKIEILLSGEYDKNNAILNLHVGVGGTDAQDWTEMLLRMYTKWAEKSGYKIETLDMLSADDAGIKSVSLKITGEFAYGYLKAEKGIHRLVRISPFNANGKRQTSFASVEVLPELTKNQDIDIKSDDLKVDTYRSSGAGGQHVNKTESAVRITHIPTGIVVQCQNERSQHHNRETAMLMLKAKLVELKERAHKEKIEDLTGELKDMGWGSQIRSYVFHPYSLVKDHRTGVENSNVASVMDGNIDNFIIAYLKQQAN
ncbi:peptide chain release factor 2 [Clostridium tyrobutyricum]|uniref:peptide chain release factor 2 n=1 Tax=Clostridium tyrobutyricum TaxID=1519 RepID=UPI001C385290|nr:peptide chain release factor 2 [Clostridium tyrobutyricum]MBV4416287.1 peptide chain release factor 2 [Clostridium tyrobutyricum]